ncbi:alpha,alpha-trehalase [Dyadobacter pollutisoli]|uniref:Trehalase family glycosidase n=1 Tax=Dyadobacter pollutisoli TaxID=2910158 RepID=A0A9E8SL30_9BACT|nr:alpha,alpha-trehalase [Dyadobacter pollutisoli]WAC13155.1 trehalase family glycosidase [Dyadobacter pollutisoli]
MIKNVVTALIWLIFIQSSFGQDQTLQFRSTDAALQTAFDRAKTMALSHKGKPGDPVGEWYEAALPTRSAFCMRDVSHQSMAAEMIGLGKANKNMFSLFAQNISDSKDWCSYWEINKDAKPAPADYRNDEAFWYNLNANFDVLNSAWQLYLWTGDKDYINGPEFANFHQKSVSDYIDRWVLQPDSLLLRPLHPNALASYDDEDHFQRCRGLASYSEGVRDLKMGVDLIAALSRGMKTYADMLRLNGKAKEAKLYDQKAEQYRQQIEKYWWSQKQAKYFTYYSSAGKFGYTEGETFLLWFDVLHDPARTKKVIDQILSREWNIENESYFPYLLGQYGYTDQVYDYILRLTDPATKRREYPEVSYGAIQGIVQGVMGISADARINLITTLFNGKKNDTNTIENLPVLKRKIALIQSQKKSSLHNTGSGPVQWRVMFTGNHAFITVNGTRRKATQKIIKGARTVSFLDVSVAANQQLTAQVN